MAEVYWIHLPEHTDMFTEGYIGITKHNAQHRFQGHVYAARRSDKSSVIGNVIRKYGPGNLIVDTLVICTEEYAAWLETKLRPEKGIGWNMAVGGDYLGGSRTVSDQARKNMSEAQKGRKLSEDTKSKIAEAVREYRTGTTHSQETKDKISKSSMGRKLSRESIEKSKSGRFYFFLRKNREIYSKAELIYQYYQENVSSYKAEILLNLNKGALGSLYNHFKRGWNPNEDSVWVEEYGKNKKEAA